MECPKDKNFHSFFETIEEAKEFDTGIGDSFYMLVSRISELLYQLPYIKLLLIYDIIFNMVQDSSTNRYFERKFDEVIERVADLEQSRAKQ